MERVESAESPARWCFFYCGSRPFAVPVESLAEVIRVERFVRLPLGPTQLAGLCTLRRDVIPVFDLVDRQETEEPWQRGRSPVLVLRAERGMWGLLVDDEEIVVAETPPEGPDQFDRGAGAVESSGQVRQGETSFSVIDPSETWHRLRGLVRFAYRS